MATKLIHNGISVQASPIHGHGVFAEKPIGKDEIVEECTIIIGDGTDTVLNFYYFAVNDQSAVLTGFGLLYNHSKNPNLTYYFDTDRNIGIFQATRFIHQGEELFISYGDHWFAQRNLQVKESPQWRQWLRYLKSSLYVRGTIACAMLLAIVKGVGHLAK